MKSAEMVDVAMQALVARTYKRPELTADYREHMQAIDN